MGILVSLYIGWLPGILVSWLRDSIRYPNVSPIILRPIGRPLRRFLLFPSTLFISDIGVNLGAITYVIIKASGGAIISYGGVIKRKGGRVRAESR